MTYRDPEYSKKHYASKKEHYLLKQRERRRRTTHSPVNLLKVMYSRQCQVSKRRGHAPPSYSAEQLVQRYIDDRVYKRLYANWIKNGEKQRDIPSLDRIDDTRGYGFDNVHMTTYYANVLKQAKKNETPICVFRNGEFIERLPTYQKAHRKYHLHYRAMNTGKETSGYTYYSHREIKETTKTGATVFDPALIPPPPKVGRKPKAKI